MNNWHFVDGRWLNFDRIYEIYIYQDHTWNSNRKQVNSYQIRFRIDQGDEDNFDRLLDEEFMTREEAETFLLTFMKGFS